MNKIKRARFEKSITQIEIYKRVGIWPSRLSLIENNHVEAREEEKLKLMEALGFEKNWLFPKDKGKNKSRNAKKGRDHGC